MSQLYKLSENKWIKNSFKTQAKHNPVNLGDIIFNFNAQDSVNKIDSRTYKGLEDEKLKKPLHDSDFHTEKAKAGKLISIFGEVAIAVIMLNGEPIFKFFQVVNYEVRGIELVSVTVVGDGLYVGENGTSKPILYHWYKDITPNSETFGLIVRDTVYEEESMYANKKKKALKRIPSTEPFVYPKNIKTIPCRIIRNTPDSSPDLIIAGEILLELNVLGSEIGQEWEYIKTQFNNLTLMGAGKKGKTIEAEVLSGKRYEDSQSPNSKFGTSVTPMISGSASLQQLLGTITWFEDRAMKYAFGGRDSSGTGTNKHNAEISLFNQAQSEMIQVKIEQRQRDYNRFFNDVVKLFVPFEGEIDIKIESSEFENGKKEGLKQAESQRELIDNQAKAQLSIKENNEANAKLKIAQTKNLSKTDTSENKEEETF